MLKMKKVFIIAFATTLFFSCRKNNDNDADYAGFIYTSTNATTGNAIIAVGREVDGSLKELKGSPSAASPVLPVM